MGQGALSTKPAIHTVVAEPKATLAILANSSRFGPTPRVSANSTLLLPTRRSGGQLHAPAANSTLCLAVNSTTIQKIRCCGPFGIICKLLRLFRLRELAGKGSSASEPHH